MWKTRKEEATTNVAKEVSPVATPSERRPFEPEREGSARSGMAYIGKTVVVKGELSGRRTCTLMEKSKARWNCQTTT